MTLISIEEADRLQCSIKRIGYQIVAETYDKSSQQQEKEQTITNGADKVGRMITAALQ